MLRKAVLTFFMVAFGLTAGTQYRENTVLFCLKSTISPLQINKSDRGITVDIPELNSFLADIQARNVELWIPFAIEADHDGDIYLNRIYRITLNETSRQALEAVRSALNSFAFVHSAELEPVRRPYYTPNDYYYNQQWFLQQIHANDAWDFWDVNGGDIPGDPTVILVSVDTGVDWDHVDLIDRIWQNLNEDADGDGHTLEYSGGQWILDPGDLNNIDDDDWDNSPSTFVDDLIGWDLSGWSGVDDNNPIPKTGVSNYSTWAHGTHVAGLLGATTDNSTGVASTSFNCRIMPVKVSQEDQTGEPYITDGYSGILYAAKAGYYSQGFSILNNSWGGLGYNQYEQATINVAHDTYHAVIVAAGGNGNDNGWGELEQAQYPSSYDNVISVCPLGSGDSWNHWATYHETIDIASPGENIRSCVINNNYASWAGSSMASPIVASSIGLLKSYNPGWTTVQLETMILATADPVIYEINPEGYLQGKLGTGRVDAEKAVEVGLFPSLEYIGDDLIIENDTDGEINPGETVEVRVILYNSEDWGTATDINGELICDSGDVAVLNGSASFWDLEPGDAGLNELVPFILEFSNTAPPGEVVCTLAVTSNAIDWVAYSTEFEVVFPVAANILYGDLNDDGLLDILDILSLVGIIMGTTEPTPQQLLAADMNGDGVIDITDIIQLVQEILAG
ncbi:MAG: S8 family serine peptidase [FCB group bacterium]|nr:S8 family serine peptidase [FCB group bacterium]